MWIPKIKWDCWYHFFVSGQEKRKYNTSTANCSVQINKPFLDCLQVTSSEECVLNTACHECSNQHD